MELPNKVEFGTDGIRGVAGAHPLDPDTVFRIGRALGRWLQGHKSAAQVVIGRDTRLSGAMVTGGLAYGLLAEGIQVIDQGVISTPGIAYLTRVWEYDMGIMVSASHNPPEQNGIKVFGADGFKLTDADEQTVLRYLENITEPANPIGPFGYSTQMGLHEYALALRAACKSEKLDGLRVVLDCANGAGYYLAPRAFRMAGAEVITMNTTPNGFNINVDAGSEHVRRDRDDLLTAIRANGADLGFAFDGDADRVVIVTPEGMLIDGDHLMGILALEMKNAGQLPGSTVVATDMSNQGLEDFLAAHDITLFRTKVGDRYVMDALRKGGFRLGGEQAGHIILLENDLTAGDGIYTALRVAALAMRSKRAGGETLHTLAARIPRYPQVIASAHLARRVDLASVPGLDGLRRETLEKFDNRGRINLRFSGTEPNLLRAMVEGSVKTSLPEVVSRAMALIEAVAAAAGTENPVVDIVDCATGAPVRL